MKHPIYYQGRRLSSLTLALLFCGFLLIALTVPGYVKKGVSCCMYPVLCVQRWCVDYLQASAAHRATVDELSQKITQLQQENHALLAQTIEQTALAHYAHGIEELLAFKKRYDLQQARCVQILSKTISEQSHTILIDAGSKQGIELDMIALYNNVLLGRVIEVYPYYSKVILISDRGCKVAAYCGTTAASGIHEGCNGRTSLLSKVSHLEKIEDQDLVISSGEGPIFPQGFALGRIIKSVRNELFYTIEVAPLLDVAQLTYCMIISKDMMR